MSEINLPHPDNVSQEEFNLDVFRKLTDVNAIAAAGVSGVASDTDVTNLQNDVSGLDDTVNNNTTTLQELQTTIAQLRLTDLSDFIIETRATGATITFAGLLGIAWEQIGDWDMDTYTSPTGWSHNLDITDRTNVRFVSCLIYNDSAGVTTEMLSQDQDSEMTVTSSLIQAQRATGGPFDNTSYNSTGFNRGYFIVVFEPNG
jgi:hypothetical protein